MIDRDWPEDHYFGRGKSMATCHPDRLLEGHGLCKQCDARQRQQRLRDAGRSWNQLNPEEARISQFKSGLKFKYGLEAYQYEILMLCQGGCCALCSAQEGNLCVDHDHTTGRVRGLLCRRCNSGIAFLSDSVIGIQVALEYLC